MRVAYDFEDARGRVLLRKVRREPKAFPTLARRSVDHVWVPPRVIVAKYPNAARYFASLLFNLPDLLDRPDEVWWTEGEKDAAALSSVGVPAVAHHQGAANATEAQAARFRGYPGRVVLVADLDGAGAACAIRRHDLLRAVGIPERRLRIVAADLWLPGSDAADHLDAGLTVEQFREPDMSRLRTVAARWEREYGRHSGHRFDLSGTSVKEEWTPTTRMKGETR